MGAIALGKSDDICGSVTYELYHVMEENGMDHIFYDMEGGHDDTVWQNALYNFAGKIFK